jgi:16S rRNA (cytidine1402-2'-O)-methyltransferase
MTYFYVVATPIGNLEDITLRAIRILKEVDLILCEDTRVTKRLLEKYDIQTDTMSYHAQSDGGKIDKIIEMIESGKNIALVSDAGTPGISDPGSVLIQNIRNRCVDENIKIIAIPGPSALVSALSIAGVPTHEFVFLGFFPHKKGRETLFAEIKVSSRTIIFYESPHRILKTLSSLNDHLSGLDKKIVIARELTKVFEEVVSGSPQFVLDYFISNQDKVRGEFVVIVS